MKTLELIERCKTFSEQHFGVADDDGYKDDLIDAWLKEQGVEEGVEKLSEAMGALAIPFVGGMVALQVLKEEK